MAVDDVYKFDLEGVFSSKRWCNSFYYVQNEADAGGDAQAIAANLGIKARTEIWTDNYKTLISNVIGSDRYKCQRFGPTKATPTFVTYASEVGTDIEPPLANSSSVVCTKYPFFWDRDFIGRNFLLPPPDDHESFNRLKTADLATWQMTMDLAIMATITITVPETLTFDQVIVSQSRYKKFIDPLEPPTLWTSVFSKVKSIQVQTVLGTQRRRRPPRDSAPG